MSRKATCSTDTGAFSSGFEITTHLHVMPVSYTSTLYMPHVFCRRIFIFCTIWFHNNPHSCLTYTAGHSQCWSPNHFPPVHEILEKLVFTKILMLKIIYFCIKTEHILHKHVSLQHFLRWRTIKMFAMLSLLPILLLLLAPQPTVSFGLSNNVLPFFPICRQLSPLCCQYTDKLHRTPWSRVLPRN